MVPGSKATELPGGLLEKYSFAPLSRHTELETLGVDPEKYILTSPSSNSATLSSQKKTGVTKNRLKPDCPDSITSSICY